MAKRNRVPKGNQARDKGTGVHGAGKYVQRRIGPRHTQFSVHKCGHIEMDVARVGVFTIFDFSFGCTDRCRGRYNVP